MESLAAWSGLLSSVPTTSPHQVFGYSGCPVGAENGREDARELLSPDGSQGGSAIFLGEVATKPGMILDSGTIGNLFAQEQSGGWGRNLRFLLQWEGLPGSYPASLQEPYTLPSPTLLSP